MSSKPHGNGISISWISHHRRSAELGIGLGLEAYFVRGTKNNILLRYLQQWLETRKILTSVNPFVVLVMQPPPIALLCVALHTNSNRTAIIGDLHTGAFDDPRWRWSTNLVLKILKTRGFAIVPNKELAHRCSDFGLEVHVCHGLIVNLKNGGVEASRETAIQRTARAQVLVPLTYSFDEPVREILDAASDTPEIDWTLTGAAPTDVRLNSPANVRFSGFVSKDEYQTLRQQADVIVALTTLESTMQSAGYEALAAATPLVTSPSRVLREYFEDSAIYASADAHHIAASVREAISNNANWRLLMGIRREQHQATQQDTFAAIRQRIEAIHG